MRGIPCVHAMAAINSIRGQAVDFCDPHFHTETWRKCYSGAIHAIPDEGLWPHFDDDQLLAPPKLVRPPGRPKKHRRRDRDEARPVTRRSATVKYGRCGIYGHNACSCQGPSTRSNAGRKAKRKRPASTVVDQPTRPAKVLRRATQNKCRNASAPRPAATHHTTVTNIAAAYYSSVSGPTTAHNSDGGQPESSTQTLASQLTQDVAEFATF
ncbi:hypothetical protein TorRG33x02_171170 [Trema orientale]|uniref:Zinc finger, PMZ-type n=1 Tax=Trema orientale TaxID=63057 RepID=A0A2P5ENL7_TREOI|nr:hypothetical protein TorRG33x02_171170 [Trema orientale]